MEPHRNLRVLPSGVLPSNAPALPDRTSGRLLTPEHQADTPLPQICQSFNQGFECIACRLHHICSTCQQPDHGANECKAGVLRVTSGNAGSNVSVPRTVTHKAELLKRCDIKPSSFSSPGPPFAAQPVLRWEQERHRVGVRHGLPNHWHCELETPRYLAYRKKCRQKDSKWSDNVEDAFQMGMCNGIRHCSYSH